MLLNEGDSLLLESPTYRYEEEEKMKREEKRRGKENRKKSKRLKEKICSNMFISVECWQL